AVPLSDLRFGAQSGRQEPSVGTHKAMTLAENTAARRSSELLGISLSQRLDNGLQMIALDLAVQSTAGDPESSRGLCQISMRGLQRPFNGEGLEGIETCGLGGAGRCGCMRRGCRT